MDRLINIHTPSIYQAAEKQLGPGEVIVALEAVVFENGKAVVRRMAGLRAVVADLNDEEES